MDTKDSKDRNLFFSGQNSEKSLENKSQTGHKSYSDIVLAFGVIAIVALMILPLPLIIIDLLVAVNILMAVGLLLLAIYIPSPIAFSSFPSVILLTTLLRLSLSVATTRLILLNADAGNIIETFGKMVAGGNIVVGMVVFIIITVVQFIVIAKGAERVAEVAARFTLDAMPGKQLSIDSDLRAGLIDQQEARQRRLILEQESQLHGSLDGAMKFVKGDTIAGIIILIINILGGLAVGVLQKDMPLSDAMHTYSILTIGDGLVAQIPALLTSISAGLIITRTADEAQGAHLGTAITRQISAYPRVFMIGGILALFFTLIPGFPWHIFLVLGLLLVSLAIFRDPTSPLKKLISQKLLSSKPKKEAIELPAPSLLLPPSSLVLSLHVSLAKSINTQDLNIGISRVIEGLKEEFGVPIPSPDIRVVDMPPPYNYRLDAFGARVATGVLMAGHSFRLSPKKLSPDVPEINNSPIFISPVFIPSIDGEWLSSGIEQNEYQLFEPISLLELHLKLALKRHLGLFLGIQETSNLINLWNKDYPDLIKEMLRVVPPQRLTEVLRALLRENISIRNLRDIFEALTEFGSREKDVVILTEQVRIALKRQISEQVSGSARKLHAILMHPELEERLRQLIRDGGNGSQLAIDPELLRKMTDSLRVLLQTDVLDSNLESGPKNKPNSVLENRLVLLCSMDIRRYMRKLIEEDFFDLTTLSYQELTGDVQVEPIGQLNA